MTIQQYVLLVMAGYCGFSLLIRWAFRHMLGGLR